MQTQEDRTVSRTRAERELEESRRRPSKAQFTQRALAWALYVTLGASANLVPIMFSLRGRASDRTLIRLQEARNALSNLAMEIRKDLRNIEK